MMIVSTRTEFNQMTLYTVKTKPRSSRHWTDILSTTDVMRAKRMARRLAAIGQDVRIAKTRILAQAVAA
jgi:hypothetical protein